MHGFIHSIAHLCLEHPKIAGAIGLGVALVFGALGFSSWKDVYSSNQASEELSLPAIANALGSKDRLWASVNGEVFWNCDNVVYEKVGDSENTTAVFTDADQTIIVIVTTYGKRLQCSEIQKSAVSGQFYLINDRYRNALIEKGIDFEQYGQAKYFMGLCTTCSRANSQLLLTISLVMVLIGLALYPLALWRKRLATVYTQQEITAMERSKSLFGSKKPVFDPAMGDRLGKVILSEARQGKFNTLLEEVSSLRAREWDRRAFYIDLAGEYVTKPKSMEKLPDTSLGNLLKGNMAIHFAWKARGSGVAETVSEKGRKLFFEYLDMAGEHLSRAAEQDSGDPTPFAFLQTVATGLQVERETADTWFEEAIRRDPTNLLAHYHHLNLLCKKWGGSHEEMYAFARATMEKTPTSSILYPIIYLAFQEHYLYLRSFDQNVEGAAAFLQEKAIQEESIKVYRDSLQKRRSIERVSDYGPHNMAAWWFMMLNMPEIVRQETEKIGPYFTQYPWAIFYRDAAVGYQQALGF